MNGRVMADFSICLTNHNSIYPPHKVAAEAEDRNFKGFFKRKATVRKVYRKKTYANTSKESVDQKKIDLILDKISKSGYDSLTKKEKETLFKAGQN